jgi:hypothetical protein
MQTAKGRFPLCSLSQNIVSRRQINCCYDVAVATGVVLLVRIAIEVLRLRHVCVRLTQSGHGL